MCEFNTFDTKTNQTISIIISSYNVNNLTLSKEKRAFLNDSVFILSPRVCKLIITDIYKWILIVLGFTNEIKFSCILLRKNRLCSQVTVKAHDLSSMSYHTVYYDIFNFY